MAIIKQYHKDTDTTYVYESISYWDAEKGQSRSKRRLIGKLDPETGEVIPTGRRGRTKKESTAAQAQETSVSNDTALLYEKSQARNRELEMQVRQLQAQVTELDRRNRQLTGAITKLYEMI